MGGTGSFIAVQLRGVRRYREVVGLSVWDVVLPLPSGVWAPPEKFLRDGCSETLSGAF